jgi:hypothetical protein
VCGISHLSSIENNVVLILRVSNSGRSLGGLGTFLEDRDHGGGHAVVIETIVLHIHGAEKIL